MTRRDLVDLLDNAIGEVTEARMQSERPGLLEVDRLWCLWRMAEAKRRVARLRRELRKAA